MRFLMPLIFVLLLSSSAMSQTAVFDIKSQDLDLVGTWMWTVTPKDTTIYPFVDYFEFRDDYQLYKLKDAYEAHQERKHLRINEFGIWEVKQDSLIVTLIGERGRKAEYEYSLPQKKSYLIRNNGDVIFLRSEDGIFDGELRLIKKD